MRTSEELSFHTLGRIGQDRESDTIVLGEVVQEEDGLAYEIEEGEMGWRFGLHASDWENLLGLAYRYGWRPSAGLDHYVRGGRQIVPPSDAQALARVLDETLRNLPPERRKEVRFEYALGGPGYEVPRPGSDADYERYFSWQRRWIVEEVLRFCQQGALEIRPM